MLPLALARTLVEERPVTKVVKMLKDGPAAGHRCPFWLF